MFPQAKKSYWAKTTLDELGAEMESLKARYKKRAGRAQSRCLIAVS